jgi:hypothetical protein
VTVHCRGEIEHRLGVEEVPEMHGFHHIPVEDLILEHELRVAAVKKYIAFKCPCWNCKGGVTKCVATIKKHLRDMPRDPYLYQSMVGADPEEGFPVDGIWIPNSQRRQNSGARFETFHSMEFGPDASTVEFLDLEHDIRQ